MARSNTTKAATPKDKVVPKGKKRCTRSGVILPATKEFFYRDKSQKDGLSPWCKDAEREYNKEYYARLQKAGVSRLADVNGKGKAPVKAKVPRKSAAAKARTTRRPARSKAKA